MSNVSFLEFPQSPALTKGETKGQIGVFGKQGIELTPSIKVKLNVSWNVFYIATDRFRMIFKILPVLTEKC